MKELNINITKLDDVYYIVSPKEKGNYDSKSFWVAHITGTNPQYGLDRKFIQKGDIAHLDKLGYYQISCDFEDTFIIVEPEGYRLSDYNEVKTLLTMWG
jgi:hypothetical protein